MSKNRNLIKELTTKLSNFKLSQEEKLDILKDCFKGEKAYLFSCGPSLLDHDEDKIKDILKNNLCFGVKQVFELYKEDLDVHFYNCANFKFYDYSKNEPIVIKCLSGGLKAGFAHISFGIEAELKKTADDFSVSISETGDLDRALLKVANTYDTEVDRTIKAVTSLLEPAIILSIGLIVMFIVVAMLLPIFQLNLMIG